MKLLPSLSLRNQLIGWNVLALTLLLGGLGLAIRDTVRGFLDASVHRELARQAIAFKPPPHQDEDNPYRAREYNLYRHRTPLDPAAFAEAALGRRTYSTVTIAGDPVQVLSEPVREHGTIVAVRQSGHSLAEAHLAMAEVDLALVTLLPIGLLGAGLGAALLTGLVLRRVRRTAHAAERITTRDLSARLPVSGGDEFSDLARAFNRLLDRIQSAFDHQERLLERQRRFAADASHELKTPLTIIKGTASLALHGASAETGYRAAIEEIDRAADTLSSLVQDLLLLGRSDSGQLGRNRTELRVRDILERSIRSTPRGGPPIVLDLEDDDLRWMGNESELWRLFANLLENAVRYTPSAGSIRVAARAVDGFSILVQVSDTGIGIAPEHLPHLGERFYRVDTARARSAGGTGLGLAICKRIVEAHRGTLSIQSALDRGTTVSVRLPEYCGHLPQFDCEVYAGDKNEFI